MAGPLALVPLFLGVAGRAAPAIGRFFFGSLGRSATTIGTGIALDGASGTDITRPLRQLAPAPVESALDGIHGAGKMTRDFAETASKTIETTTNLLGKADKGLLAGGGLFAASLFMEDGPLKKILEIGVIALLLDFGSRWLTGKGLTTHFNSLMGAPAEGPAQKQGMAPGLVPGGM